MYLYSNYLNCGLVVYKITVLEFQLRIDIIKQIYERDEGLSSHK